MPKPLLRNPGNVMLVDGLNMMHRAHHSFAELRAGKVLTGATYGFISMMFANMKKWNCDYVVVCWEGGHGPSQNWREAIAQDYKANRKRTDRDTDKARIATRLAIHKQAAFVQEGLSILHIPQINVPGMEADDLIGILSKTFEDRDECNKVFIVSSDRDFNQLLSDKVFVLRSAPGGLRKIGPSDVFKQFGVHPVDWSKWRAFVGDKGDNYEGIKMIGPKTATKMVRDGIDASQESFEHHRACVRKVWRKKIAHVWHLAVMSYKLSQIPRECEYALLDKKTRIRLRSAHDEVLSELLPTITSKEYKRDLQRWTEWCARFEFNYFLANRRRYFQRLRVT